MKVVVIIPAFNEEKSIGLVLDDIPRNLVSEVLVVDNNSSDQTARVAERHGATVLTETELGYGSACLAGIFHAQEYRPDVIVFLDGDYSDHPKEMSMLLDKISDGFDLVIGSRVLGKCDRERCCRKPVAATGSPCV
ncbi:MAG: glycosyltransferase family 2 protein [bacterium]